LLPHIDLAILFKVAGALLTACGSIVLALRVKGILSWVKHCLVAHENNIQQLQRILEGKAPTMPLINGTIFHLDNAESQIGAKLLILGFVSLSFGMIFTAISYLI
jgi:hypothetical protein